MSQLLGEMASFVFNKMLIRCKPDPIVICQMKEETYMDRHLQQGDIQAATSYLKCSYVMSKPTGVNNLSVTNEFLTKKENKEGK